MEKTNSYIVPAILEQRLSAIQHKCKLVSGIVPIVQVDICDGMFVPSLTYARSGRVSPVRKLIQTTQKYKLQLELDLMVDLDQPRAMDQWTTTLSESQPKQVVFHLGSTYRWNELFASIQNKTRDGGIPFKCGLAVRLDHTRNEIRKALESYDSFEYIQIMGIEKVGYSGQKLSPKVFDRIRRIKRAFPQMPIQVDGGVKVEDTAKLRKAGATRVGMNSGLYTAESIVDLVREVSNA